MMKFRSFATFCLTSAGLLLVSVSTWAQGASVLTSTPAANSSIEGRSSGFSVRFDRPVDHVHSLLVITQDGKIVETLHPRLGSAPDVLFARAPMLPPGAYKLHWEVGTLADVGTAAGDIPFTVIPGQ